MPPHTQYGAGGSRRPHFYPDKMSYSKAGAQASNASNNVVSALPALCAIDTATSTHSLSKKLTRASVSPIRTLSDCHPQQICLSAIPLNELSSPPAVNNRQSNTLCKSYSAIHSTMPNTAATYASVAPASPSSLIGADDRCAFDEDEDYENQEPSSAYSPRALSLPGSSSWLYKDGSGYCNEIVHTPVRHTAGRRRSLANSALVNVNVSTAAKSSTISRRLPTRSPYDSSELDILMDHMVHPSDVLQPPHRQSAQQSRVTNCVQNQAACSTFYNNSVTCASSEQGKASPVTHCALILPKDMSEMDTDDYGCALADSDGNSEADSLTSTDDDAETAVNDVSMSSSCLDKSYIMSLLEDAPTAVVNTTATSFYEDDLDTGYDHDDFEMDCTFMDGLLISGSLSSSLTPSLEQTKVFCSTPCTKRESNASMVTVDKAAGPRTSISSITTLRRDSIDPSDQSSVYQYDSLDWSGLPEILSIIDDSDFVISPHLSYRDLIDEMDKTDDDAVNHCSKNHGLSAEYDLSTTRLDLDRQTNRSSNSQSQNGERKFVHSCVSDLSQSSLNKSLESKSQQSASDHVGLHSGVWELSDSVTTNYKPHCTNSVVAKRPRNDDLNGDCTESGVRPVRRRHQLHSAQTTHQHHSWSITAQSLPSDLTVDKSLLSSGLCPDKSSCDSTALAKPALSYLDDSACLLELFGPDTADLTKLVADSSLSGSIPLDITYVPPWYQPSSPLAQPCILLETDRATTSGTTRSLCAVCAKTPTKAASLCCQQVGQQLFSELLAIAVAKPRHQQIVTEALQDIMTCNISDQSLLASSLLVQPSLPQLSTSTPSPKSSALKNMNLHNNIATATHILTTHTSSKPASPTMSLYNRSNASFSSETILTHLLPTPAQASNNFWLPFTSSQLYQHIQPYIPNIAFPSAYSRFNYVENTEVDSWIQMPDNIEKIRCSPSKVISKNFQDHTYTRQSRRLDV
ncbi:hypothetical protein QVD99_004134 [Batrachochytrium dendrobatidis]|nr:hypothetical protein QVD99_004134 [Batrachochytrium dendrobatidis]